MNDLSKKQARNKLKLAKENLELELITQEEYDSLKKELKPIIMDEISNDEKNLSQKNSDMIYFMSLFIVICLTITFIHEKFKSSHSTISNKKEFNASKFIRSVNTLAGTYKQQLGRMEFMFTFYLDNTFFMENNLFGGIARGGRFRINNNKIHLEYYDGGNTSNGTKGLAKQTLIWEAEGKIVYKDNVFLK